MVRWISSVACVTVVRSLCQQVRDDDGGHCYITYMILLEKEWKGKPRGWGDGGK